MIVLVQYLVQLDSKVVVHVEHHVEPGDHNMEHRVPLTQMVHRFSNLKLNAMCKIRKQQEHACVCACACVRRSG